tara:strand:+ start:61 stop:1092 length:1032 start_codon:yes stop_codon:yes gene_type:complete
MQINQLTKKVRIFAALSFIIPLLTLNCCLLIYKLLGNILVFPNYDFDKAQIEYSYKESIEIEKLDETFTYTNCPKYNNEIFFITKDDQKINETSKALLESAIIENNIKSILILRKESLNYSCIKNYPLSYFILNNFSFIEEILLDARKSGLRSFSKIKNPYLYGEVSISRTARYYPVTFIFKPFIILSAVFLFLYWRNNLHLLSNFKNENLKNKFSKLFFYFGVLSCIFLILHASFLGLDIESKIFSRIRRIIIILFILSEIIAQILLTKNLFVLKEHINKYINYFVLKIKIIFVSAFLIITFVSLAVLAFNDPSTEFKHILEWNYFSALLLYYVLSMLLWKR